MAGPTNGRGVKTKKQFSSRFFFMKDHVSESHCSVLDETWMTSGVIHSQYHSFHEFSGMQ